MKKDIKLNLEGKDLSCFDEAQREVVLDLVQDAVGQISAKNSLADADEYSDVSPAVNALMAKDSLKAQKMANVWKNNGRISGLKERVTIGELIDHSQKWKKQLMTEGADAGFTSTDHPYLIERAISQVVKEAVEPNIVLTGLLSRINYQHGTQLTFPAMGAMAAADIPEGGEYPERSLDFAGQVTATIGKSGIAVKVTEEMVRYSMFDVISMHLTAAGRALVRHKEQKVADMLIDNGGGANTLFDNTSASYKSTTGRDASGAYNGTLTLDDLFRAYSIMVNRGFTPDTLIMNPFGWQIFADEAIARAFGFINGMSMWGALQGSPGSAPSFNGPSPLLTQSAPTAAQNLATTYTNVPSIFPAAFNIIVTPYMPFDEANNTTDLLFCSRSELGVLVVDEEVMTDQFNDPARDIMKIKLRERYGLASMNNGSGTGLIKGVSLSRGYDFSRTLEAAAVTLATGLTGDEGFSGVV